MRLWPHRILGHRWRYRGIKECPGCMRHTRVWSCPCGSIRHGDGLPHR